MTIQDAQDLTWDIGTLVDGRGEEGVDSLLEQAHTRAVRLAESKGKLDGFSGTDLEAFMAELGEIRELIGRAGSYAHLSFSTDTQDPARGALLQKVQERATEISTLLLFFELEWTKLDADRATTLLEHPGLESSRHYLSVMRRFRDYLLSEPEERILNEKSVTGRAAWMRLFSDLTAAMEVELDGETATLEQALSRLSSHDREARRLAASAVTVSLQDGIRTRGYIFNMLLHDKATDDKMRGYGHWLQGFNLSQEASDESVEALVTAVRDRYDLAQRWYVLKAKLLGLDKLAYYDRNASITDDDAEIDWPAAKEMVLDCYTEFSAEAGDLVRRFFEDRWIDVPAKPGKVPGAFSAPTVSGHHPYVLLNFTNKRRDVMTLAHELGHGLHQSLGSRQGPFHHTTPLTVAETASVFGETIVFNRLLDLSDSPRDRFALLAEKVKKGAIGTVFRRVAMNGYEARVHIARRSEGELSVERLGDLWIETQTEMLGDSVELDDEYRSWWSYIPHFIHVPGYVYAYTFGHLLATSVYAQYEKRGTEFVPQYLEMLAAGGSRPPEELAQIVDCDLADKSFWDQGLTLIERDIERAEDAAAAL